MHIHENHSLETSKNFEEAPDISGYIVLYSIVIDKVVLSLQNIHSFIVVWM